VRWKHQVGGRISGSSTVIGNVVYFSNLGNKTTIGLNAVSGRQVFTFPDGAFTPMIADYHALYLDGYATIYQLLPGHKPTPHAKHQKHKKHKKHKAKHHAKAKAKHAKAKAKAKSRKKQAAHKVHHAARKKKSSQQSQ
jgi:hypothetical protein